MTLFTSRAIGYRFLKRSNASGIIAGQELLLCFVEICCD
jgi:hypothetical protein